MLCYIYTIQGFHTMPLSPPDIPKQIGNRKLTLKDRRFLDYYLEGRPLHECEKHAGRGSKNVHSLASMGYERLKRMNIQFDELLEIKGLSDSVVAGKIREGLNSYRVGFATLKGKITDTLRSPDFSARAKFVELLGKATGKVKERSQVRG